MVMAFQKTARIMAKVEAVREKESGREVPTESTSELGCISEEILAIVHSRF